MVSLSQGILVAFEGIDGSGKSTQIYKVADYLRERDYTVTVTHQPNPKSPYARLIKQEVHQNRDNTLPEKELEWYTKDRAWDLQHNILPALERKELVLVDRYYLSSAAYQGSLDAFTLEYVLEKNSFARRPDLWLILDVSVKLGQTRLQQRGQKLIKEDQLERIEFQEKVLTNYKRLSEMDIGGIVEWVDASIDEPLLTEVISELIIQFIQEFCL
ncbi:MAG: dTMP kinase [Candidatus Hodarchaeales archaeon]|jgi:dTMP kinase